MSRFGFIILEHAQNANTEISTCDTFQIQNGHIHVYCINMYVKIYPNESGYNYYYNECCFFSYQNSNKLKETDCEFAGFFFVLIVIY